MNTSNLPTNIQPPDSAAPVRTFFENYYSSPVSFPADQIDAVIGFFKERGFDTDASNSTAIVLMQQAKRDNVNIFTLIDTLKGLSDVQLSSVVAEVLNFNRQTTSVLGYRKTNTSDYFENRNVRL